MRPGLPGPCFFECTISSNKEIEIDQHKQKFISESISHKISAHLLFASGSSAEGQSTAAPHGPLQGQAEACRSCVRDARPCGYPTGGELITTTAGVIYRDRLHNKARFVRLWNISYLRAAVHDLDSTPGGCVRDRCSQTWWQNCLHARRFGCSEYRSELPCIHSSVACPSHVFLN